MHFGGYCVFECVFFCVKKGVKSNEKKKTTTMNQMNKQTILFSKNSFQNTEDIVKTTTFNHWICEKNKLNVWRAKEMVCIYRFLGRLTWYFGGFFSIKLFFSKTKQNKAKKKRLLLPWCGKFAMALLPLSLQYQSNSINRFYRQPRSLYWSERDGQWNRLKRAIHRTFSILLCCVYVFFFSSGFVLFFLKWHIIIIRRSYTTKTIYSEMTHFLFCNVVSPIASIFVLRQTNFI